MTATCIDLKERFGERYRVVNEESHAAAYGPNARTHDPWLLIIPCRHGHVFPWGGDRLAVSTRSRGPIANELAGLDCTAVVQDGSDGYTMTFDMADFPAVAKIVKPRLRRQLSPEHKAKLLAASKPFQPRLAVTQAQEMSAVCDISPLAVV